MNALKIILAVLLGIVAAVGVNWFFHQSPAPAPASAPEAPASTGPAVSGNYADDWQSRCGPLTAADQAACTAQLDAAYGRKADMPVPKP